MVSFGELLTIIHERWEQGRASLLGPAEATVVLREPDGDYPLKNGKTTFYVCQGHSCQPPANELPNL